MPRRPDDETAFTPTAPGSFRRPPSTVQNWIGGCEDLGFDGTFEPASGRYHVFVNVCAWCHQTILSHAGPTLLVPWVWLSYTVSLTSFSIWFSHCLSSHYVLFLSGDDREAAKRRKLSRSRTWDLMYSAAGVCRSLVLLCRAISHAPSQVMSTSV